MAEENKKLYAAFEAGRRQELKTIIPTAREEKTFWRMTAKKPADDWASPAFNDSEWRKSAGGFGAIGGEGRNVETAWTSKQIWLRKKFDMPESNCAEPILSVFHNDSAEIYINGVIAASETGAINGYALIPVEPDAVKSVKPKDNVIAVTCKAGGAWQYIDVGVEYYLQ